MLALSQPKKKSMLPIPILEKLEGKFYIKLILKRQNEFLCSYLLNEQILLEECAINSN